MSYKPVDAVEFDCDGACGASKQVPVRSTASSHDPALPPGWAELRLTQEAAKAIGRTTDLRMQFCPVCFSLITVLLWREDRQLKFLPLLSVDELDDYDLDGLLDKLKAKAK